MNLPVLQQAAAAAADTSLPQYETVVMSPAKGGQLQQGVVHLPPLSLLSSSADGSPVLKQLILPNTTYSDILKKGTVVKADKRACMTASKVLRWLESQAEVVAAVQEAVQVNQEQQRQQQDLERIHLLRVLQQQQQQKAI